MIELLHDDVASMPFLDMVALIEDQQLDSIHLQYEQYVSDHHTTCIIANRGMMAAS